MSENRKPLLQVEDINVYYGAIHAIRGISFEVYPDEIVTLIGANGAGKSTTLNTIAGLLRPRSAHIVLEGKGPDNHSRQPDRIPGHGPVPRGAAHLPADDRAERICQMGGYTAGRDSRLFGDVHPLPPPQGQEKQYRHPLRRRAADAGHGPGADEQAQAAHAGRALHGIGAHSLVEQIFDIIKELHQAGVTILLVEQNAQMALSIADRAYVLETGRIAMTGEASALLKNDDVRKAYLGS